MLSSSNT